MRDGRKMKGVTEDRQRERDERKKEWVDGRKGEPEGDDFSEVRV